MHTTLCTLDDGADKVFERVTPGHPWVEITGVVYNVPEHMAFEDDIVVQSAQIHREPRQPVVVQQENIALLQHLLCNGARNCPPMSLARIKNETQRFKASQPVQVPL